MKLLALLPRYIWASPATLMGLLFVPVALVSGGTVRRVQGVLEIEGGLVANRMRWPLADELRRRYVETDELSASILKFLETANRH